jgi:hypothetical protein
MNHKAGTQRLRTNVKERDIDYSCVQYIYTKVYRTSDESKGGDTEVTYIRNRKRSTTRVCSPHILQYIEHQMNHKAGTQSYVHT